MIKSVPKAIMVLLLFSGCAQLRKYVANDNGSLSLRLRDQWGEGANVRTYYVTSHNDIINLGDSGRSLLKYLGYPDKNSYSYGGYEIWTYKERKVSFYMDNGLIKAIESYADKRPKKK